METENLFKTPLCDEHISLGARMVPFAGWLMPVQYPEGILAEHKHTRTYTSLFDICHMGEFRIKGKESAVALDRILAREVVNQKIGTCRYNFLLCDKGTVMDDLIVYRIAEDEFFIVVNAGTRPGDAARFKELLPSSCSFSDESDITAKLDLQGPGSANVMEKLGIKKETMPGYFSFIHTNIKSMPCIFSRTGYTGELGFEIYVNVKHVVELWRMLLACDNVKPAGLGSRDTLRLEMGYALYGHELNLETTPVEAGYAPLIKLESGRNFAGSDALRKNKPSKTLVAVELEGRRAAREGSLISINGKMAGKVTSGAFSPSLEKAIAMAYISSGFPVETGTELTLEAGKALIKGKITDLPFYKNATARKKL